MDIEKIKQRILDLAIRGKLVPQDPNDEPASVLIEKIKAEKEKLVKDGKIKPSKNESYIYKDSDNCYYENNRKSNIDYDLPNNWIKTKLGSIGLWGAGATPLRSNSKYYNNGIIPWIKTGELNNSYIYDSEEKITEFAIKECSLREIQVNDVLIAMYGATIGKLGIAKRKMTSNQACCACTPFSFIIPEYLFYYLMAIKPLFIEQGFGGAQPNISKEKITKTDIVFPSITEQQKICNKIKECFLLLDKINNNLNDISICLKICKNKILDNYFGDNSSYKSYYPSKHLNELCKLSKNDISTNGSLPYLEAKFIRGLKEPSYVTSGSFVKKGSKIILVDGENSGEVMVAPCNGYLCSTFKILELDNSINENYLMYFIKFHKDILKNNKTGSAVPHLNKKIFGTLMIPTPPIQKQKEIAETIKHIEEKINIIVS